MPEIISITSFLEFNILQRTESTADIVVGGTTVNIKNSNGFDTDHVILIGEPGAEGSEVRTPSGVSGKVVTIDALTQDHKTGVNVYLLRSNKARIYAAPNVDGTRPTTDTYVLLDAVTHIGDKKEIEYTHSSGGSDYWYLYTFFNDVPIVDEETSKVLADAIRGGGYGNYATTDEVRAEAGLNGNRWIKDSFIYDKLVYAESEVDTSLLIGKYTLPLSTIPGNVRHATILLAAGYLLTTDYGPEHSGTNKDGEHKIAMARKILAKFEAGQGRLVDETGAVISTGSAMNGYPDSTAETSSPSEARVFSMNDTF